MNNDNISVSDPSDFDVDPDPDPHLGKVDPDPRIHVWKKWIRIWIRVRESIFHIFHKEISVGQITILFCYCQNLEMAFLR